MRKDIELLLRFVNAKLALEKGEKVTINFLGDNEVQTATEYSGFTNYQFDDKNPIGDAILRIIEMYYRDEVKHRSESKGESEEQSNNYLEKVYSKQAASTANSKSEFNHIADAFELLISVFYN